MFKKSDIKDIYELSPLQKGMLFHYLHDKGNNAYFEQIDFTIEGCIDLQCLEESFNRLIQKYDIFRTVFLYEKVSQPIQVVLKERKAKIYFEDISYLKENKEKYIELFKERERDTGFDLSSDLLIRFSLIKTDSKHYHLIWSFHHILMDGWCLGLVLSDLFDMYQNILKKEEMKLERETPYSEYIRWLTKQNKNKAEEYWKTYLQDFSNVTEIPFKVGKINDNHYVKKDIFFKLDSHLTNQLASYAKAYQVTQNTIFRAIWGILLQSYNDTNDVVFGTVVSGRPSDIPNVEKIVGLFINTIPVRVQSSPEETFVSLIKKIQEVTSESEGYNYMSLADIQTSTALSGGLFDHIVAFENYPLDTETLDKKSETLGFKIKDSSTFEQTNFDFNVLVLPGSELTVKFSFNKEVHSEHLVANIFKHLEKVVRQVVAQPDIQVKEIEIVTDEEKEQLLVEFNDTKMNYPRTKTIHELFEEQAEKTPKHTAVVCGEKQLTYEQLNERANQLASVLREKGVTREKLVGIMVEPSLEMIVSVLSVLKAGGAYLPIDPAYPSDRIQYMLEDSQAQWLLTQEELAVPPDYVGEVIMLDQKELYQGDGSNLKHSNQVNDLAYVIYTSGSTGRPKGVMIEHQSLVNLCTWHNQAFAVTEHDRSTKFAGFGFDASVWEIYPYLIIGGELHIIQEAIRYDVHLLNQYFEENGITISFLPTQFAEQFMEIDNQSLRFLLIGGDRVQRVQDRKYKIVNNYGPTENTIVTTAYQVEKHESNIPIGKPISNTQIYIVDRNQQLVPKGVVGELCIAGESLSRGYLNQPDLSAEKFVDNPFNPGTKIYKTGDLAKWLPDGNIVFMGRLDHQVKIRGYRIELGEVEAALSTHPSVKEAIVSVTDENLLIAYIVPKQQTNEQIDQWKQYLSKKLPEHMIPTAFIMMEMMPLNQNGKIDRKALPKPADHITAGMEYTPPTTELEKVIAGIWQEVLQREQVGVHDHFFALGGHSLKAMMLVSRMMKKLQVQISVREVFTRPTVKEMANYIKEAEGSSYPAIELVEKREFYPVSSMQKRLYAIQLIDGVNTAYHVPLVLKIEGKLNLEQLKKAFQLLVKRHESFRTSFHLIDGELVQKIESNIILQIEQFKAENDAEVKDKMQSFMKPFDLSQAPLSRVGLMELPKEQYVLLIDMHHIISDGISMGIIMKELTDLYEEKELPALRFQYKDFAVWQQKLTDTELYQKQEAYWLNQLTGELPILDLPTDYLRPSIQKFNGSLVSYELNKELTKKLKEFASSQGATLFMTLFAAYNTLLYKYSGKEDIIVGSSVAGRPQSDLESVVGMFVNTIALRNYPKGSKTFRQFLAEMKERMLTAYEHTDYPLEELVEKLDIRRDLSRNPLFDTMFVLQNMEMSELIFPEVTIKEEMFEWENAKMDLSWTITEGENMNILLEYSTSLFKTDTIQRMVRHFNHILEQILREPDICLDEIELVTEEEKQQLLVNFNDTFVEYRRDKTIHELFEEQVVKTPNHLAVVYDDEKQLTFHQLNERANQLARVLRKKGVTQEKIVGIMVEPSLEMIVSVLSVLKAGGAYLPIDSGYPEDRIHYMLENSGANWLLIQEGLEVPQDYLGEIIVLNNKEWYQGTGTNLTNVNQVNDLAYVIYTSGSTGKPKGVLLEHASFLNMCNWNTNYYQLTEKDRITKYAGFGFDASVWEIFPPLLKGSTLYIVPRDIRLDVEKLNAYYKDNQITISFLPTQMCEQFLPLANQSLRILQTAGDQLKQANKHPLSQYKLINNYGPTENTIVATAYQVKKQASNIPIGKPISNTQIYIVDRNEQLVPIGVVGELCIAGESLARGYLNQSDLTAEKFVNNPFKLGTKMYKTGDLAKWLPDGNIVFIGRLDHQVKIRGYRIELGEVEVVLSRHPSVKEVIVTVTDQKQLVAYIVSKQQSEDQIDEWKQYLSEKIPDYMIPTAFITMEAIPLNQNGKVDRKALPKPIDYIQTRAEYVAPTSQIEERLVEIWREVLKVNQVGIHDNFFELGGDSIKGMQFIAHLYKYHWKLVMKDLYLYPTISQVIPYIKSIHDNGGELVEGDVPLTPIQKWIFEITMGQIDHVNVNLILENKDGWHVEPLKIAFQKVIEHHDALRMIYSKKEGEMIQINRGIEENVFAFNAFDLTSDSHVLERIEHEVLQLNKRTNVMEGPLVNLSLFRSAIQDYLVISIHHLLMDDISGNILIDDFKTSYQQAIRKELIVLPPKTTSYQTWSRKLQEYANSEDFLTELPYWREIQNTRVKPLPKDMEGLDTCTDLDIITLTMTEEETNSLFHLMDNELQAEPFELLLTALGLTIRQWSKEDRVLINLERHGREEIISGVDVSRTIGWFNAHSPVILSIHSEEWPSALQSVQEVLRKVPNKGIGYGILKYFTSPEKKEFNTFNLQPEISFNYHGRVNQELEDGFTQIIHQIGPTYRSMFRIPFSLYMNAIILDGELQVRFVYSSHLYRKETINVLSKQFKENLMRYSEYCAAIKTPVVR